MVPPKRPHFVLVPLDVESLEHPTIIWHLFWKKVHLGVKSAQLVLTSIRLAKQAKNLVLLGPSSKTLVQGHVPMVGKYGIDSILTKILVIASQKLVAHLKITFFNIPHVL